jgi:hypothetical protein
LLGALRLIWEIEAMLGTIFTVGAMALHRHNVNKENEKHNETTIPGRAEGTREL